MTVCLTSHEVKKMQDPPRTEARRRICPNCGKEFFAKSVHHYSMRRERHCSSECKMMWSEKRAHELLDADEPLVEMFDDHIVCRICGAHLKIAGTHFLREHGLRGGPSVSITDRLAWFNLPKGSRLASAETRKRYSNSSQSLADRGITSKQWEAGLRAAQEAQSSGKFAADIKRTKPSEAQLKACSISIVSAQMAIHAKGCVKAACLTCGSEFFYVKSAKRKFCSKVCAYAASVERCCKVCGATFTAKLVSASSRCQKCKLSGLHLSRRDK